MSNLRSAARHSFHWLVSGAVVFTLGAGLLAGLSSGCGHVGSSGPFGFLNGQSGVPSGQGTTSVIVPPASILGRTYRGKVSIRFATLVPDDVKDQVLAHRAEIESPRLVTSVPNGVSVESDAVLGNDLGSLKVTEGSDGVVLAWPQRPGGGYIVRLGDRVSTANTDGNFVIDTQIGDSDDLQIVDPGGDVLWTLSLTALVEQGKLLEGPVPGQTIHLIVPFDGPCGMNPASDDLCGPQPRPRTLQPAIRPRVNTVDRARNYDPGRLGSYPRPGSKRCITDDGFIEIGGVRNWIFYINSTCDYMVRHGACLSEYPWTDIEAVTLGRFLGENDGRATYIGGISQAFTDGSRCFSRHKGRYCDQILTGDLGLEAGDKKLIFNQNSENVINLTVKRGDSIPILVHNNGNYGETLVDFNAHQLRGTLTGKNLTAPSISGSTVNSHTKVLHHYDADKLQTYIQGHPPVLDPSIYTSDQQIVYTVPPDLPDSALTGTDTIVFAADGRTLSLNIVIAPAYPLKATYSGTLAYTDQTDTCQQDPLIQVGVPRTIPVTVVLEQSSATTDSVSVNFGGFVYYDENPGVTPCFHGGRSNGAFLTGGGVSPPTLSGLNLTRSNLGGGPAGQSVLTFQTTGDGRQLSGNLTVTINGTVTYTAVITATQQ